MRIAIAMPVLGYDMQTGRIAAWLKAIGEPVERGEVILEIETEKTTIGMEALATGRLVEKLVDPGLDVPIGTIIGYLETEA